jgi:hypothetical protein
LLEPTIDVQFFADVLEHFEAHARETGFEGLAMIAEKLQRLKGIGQGKSALKIDGQLVQRRGDAELGGTFLE